MFGSRLALGFAAPLAVVTLAITPTGAFAATTLTAEATADQESAGGAEGASASGEFRVDVDAGQFCYTVTAEGLDGADAMHIHKGGAGVDGDVVIPLDPKAIDGGETCTDAETDLLQAIVDNPGGYYLNVHTPDFPDGAARGQLAGGLPSGVDAGTGGQADGGAPIVPIVLVLTGGVLAGAATWRLARR